ncbi:hypothetical protein TNCV_4988371 [Trichonephila clavipes]|nr:hypothetical protein TNCV_4988371 [Trichonephila clavipes]
MPSPVQSNCDAHDTIANGQYGAVWSMGHTNRTIYLSSAGVVLLTRPPPCPSTIPVVLNDFHSRENNACLSPIILLWLPELNIYYMCVAWQEKRLSTPELACSKLAGKRPCNSDALKEMNRLRNLSIND